MVPPSSARSGVSELDPAGRQPDASGDLGPWVLLWGGLALAVALFLHGPVFFLASLGLCGAAAIAALLSRRRFRAGTPQRRVLALLGVCLALLTLALLVARLVGHPLVEWGWAWRFH
jgi:drug/metabolite transporter (DMT)-like permease